MSKTILDYYSTVISCKNYALKDMTLEEIEREYKNNPEGLKEMMKNKDSLEPHM